MALLVIKTIKLEKSGTLSRQNPICEPGTLYLEYDTGLLRMDAKGGRYNSLPFLDPDVVLPGLSGQDGIEVWLEKQRLGEIGNCPDQGAADWLIREITGLYESLRVKSESCNPERISSSSGQAVGLPSGPGNALQPLAHGLSVQPGACRSSGG